MELAFLLAKSDIGLSREEALAVVEHESSWLHGNLLIISPKKQEDIRELQDRLAFTLSIHEVLFSCPVSRLLEKMEHYPWKSIYHENFCVRAHHLSISQQYRHNTDEKNRKHSIHPINANNHDRCNGQNDPNENKDSKEHNGTGDTGNFSEQELARFIWKAVEHPVAKLRNSKTAIHLFFYNGHVVCARQFTRDSKKFEERRPHLRIFSHSGSMHPRLARALVNLLGAKQGEKVMDPCCGSGGFLIEAAMMGLEAEGYDINRKMVWGCMRNMAQQGIAHYQVAVKDALSLEGKWSHIITDLPYGLNSVAMSRNERVSMKRSVVEKENLEEFYSSFFRKLKEILGKRAVVVMPHFVDYRRIITGAGLRIEREFEQYVHGSLTRRIVVLTT